MIILDYDLVRNRIKTDIEKEIDNRLNYHSSLLNQRLIGGRQNWEITGALSNVRPNCIEWLPITEGENILEIGAGYGCMTEMLSEKGANVLALENDFVKCQMIEKRTSIYGRVNTIIGRIEDVVEKIEHNFSKIILVGCLPELSNYIANEAEKENSVLYMILLLMDMLLPDGQLIIADDNRLGLKFFNGAKYSDCENYYAQIEKNNTEDKVRLLLSRGEMEDVLSKVECSSVERFYPYPDYKYTDTIYSDDKLPSDNELNVDIYNWEKYGFNYFKDSLVYNSIIKEGLFPYFSNSYLYVISKSSRKSLPIYVKYSNDRSYKFQIRTEIWHNSEVKRVKKIALNSSVNKHLRRMRETYQESRKLPIFLENEVDLCKMNFEIGCASYDYVEGENLSNKVSKLIRKQNYDDVETIFDRLSHFIYDDREWTSTLDFESTFMVSLDGANLHASTLNNIDLILPNIIEDSIGDWTIIDYEWAFDFPVPAEYILWRSIFYILKTKSISSPNEKWRIRLYEKFGIDENLRDAFLMMEKSFQKYVSKGNIPIRELARSKTNFNTHDVGEFFVMKDGKWDVSSKTKIDGVSAENGRTCFTIRLHYNQHEGLRVDPSNQKCIVHVNSITNGYGVSLGYETNCSKRCGAGNYLFLHKDPQIIIKDMSMVVDRIEFDYEILNLHDNFAL